MNVKYFILLFLFVFKIAASQVSQIVYKHVRSNIVTLNETLFINQDGKIISVQEGIKSDGKTSNNQQFTTFTLNSPDYHFISNSNQADSRDIFFTSKLKDQIYFIQDLNVPKPSWKINYKKSKKILGYTCYYATCLFRGSMIQAYFTKQISISTGPFKFFGLPGLILYVKEIGEDYNIWSATSINLDYKDKVDFNPQFPLYKRLNIKDFVGLLNENYETLQRKFRSIDLPGSTAEEVKKNKFNRYGIEKLYEWEQ